MVEHDGDAPIDAQFLPDMAGFFQVSRGLRQVALPARDVAQGRDRPGDVLLAAARAQDVMGLGQQRFGCRTIAG